MTVRQVASQFQKSEQPDSLVNFTCFSPAAGLFDMTDQPSVFTFGFQQCQCSIHLILWQRDDHANATVEGAVHFVSFNVAVFATS